MRSNGVSQDTQGQAPGHSAETVEWGPCPQTTGSLCKVTEGLLIYMPLQFLSLLLFFVSSSPLTIYSRFLAQRPYIRGCGSPCPPIKPTARTGYVLIKLEMESCQLEELVGEAPWTVFNTDKPSGAHMKTANGAVSWSGRQNSRVRQSETLL